MLNFSYPYTDFHELNLDWIIRKIKELGQAFNDFEAVNKITNAGAWDITKQYQAWTIVSDNNMGYISLKPVPIGVAITNTEYWGLVADYDILITDLSSRISALEVPMSAINTMNGKSVLIIGDSLGDTTIADLQPNYVTNLTNKLAKLGATVTNNSLGGRSLSANLPGTTEGIMDAVASVTGSYDIIIVELGINDWACGATRAQVVSALNSFVSWTVNNQPDAEIYFITPLSTTPDQTKAPVDFYRGAILNIATNLRFHIIDMYTASTPYSGALAAPRDRWTRNGDGVHPNPAFAVYYADIIYKALVYNFNTLNLCTISGYTLALPLINAGYYHGDGTVNLIGTNTTYTPSNKIVTLGVLPEFLRPFVAVTKTIFAANSGNVVPIEIYIKPDGATYAIFPQTGIAYSDIEVNITYNSLNKTYINS